MDKMNVTVTLKQQISAEDLEILPTNKTHADDRE